MIRSAQNTTKKLLIEDSGIAMPISLLVFLFLTFVCMSVFALGEVIRARTELQYKVDNAAYAAALVQADSLSRIAVLNRALAWTYAQTNKRQMDYIVNRWLSESYDAFIEDANEAEMKHSGGCALHTMSPTRKTTADRHTSGFEIKDAIYYMVTNENYEKLVFVLNSEGRSGTLLTPLHGLFTPGSTEDGAKNIYTLKTILDGEFSYNHYEVLEKEIAAGNKNMQIMQQQLTDITSNLHTRIQQSVDSFLPGNNKVLYGGKSEKSSSGFLTGINDESEIFTRYKQRFNVDLTETWSDRPWWAPDAEKTGCFRKFVSTDLLSLNWTGYGVKWECESGQHTAALIHSGENTVNAGVSPIVLGGTDWGSNMKSVLLLPFKIDKSFFGKEGSIVVAAKAPIPDLFGNVFGKNKFLNFRVDGNLWAVSAARAGYRNGEKYENSKFLNEEQWNLFEDDWEPMFLPVGRCWKSWDGEKFTGDDAYNVLQEVADNLDINISENGLKLNEKVNLDALH